MKRVIIYARVSTRDQNVDMQLIDLRAYAKARQLEIVEELVDYASGSKNDRENYQILFDRVRKRKTETVLVWKFDRFARSTKELINALDEFRDLGVDFISYKENVDSNTTAELKHLASVGNIRKLQTKLSALGKKSTPINKSIISVTKPVAESITNHLKKF